MIQNPRRPNPSLLKKRQPVNPDPLKNQRNAELLLINPSRRRFVALSKKKGSIRRAFAGPAKTDASPRAMCLRPRKTNLTLLMPVRPGPSQGSRRLPRQLTPCNIDPPQADQQGD